MKFRIEQKNLLAGMQRVVGVVEKRNTMPILSHVLLKAYQADGNGANEGRISFFATDLEMGICDDYPAQIEKVGRITLSARKLLEIVHELPEGLVEIQQLEKNWVSIASGNATFKIAGLPPEEFPAPALSEGESRITIDPALLTALIGKTFFAVGENNSRYVLNGILIQIQNISEAKSTIRMVATDGNRLALAEGLIKRPKEWSLEEQVILPKKAVLEIKRVLDEIKSKEKGMTPTAGDGAPVVAKKGKGKDTPIPGAQKELEITLGKGLFTFKVGSLILTSRLMHGNYPNYQQVIPKENDKKVSTNTGAFYGALGRVSILSREKTHTVSMIVGPGEIVLHADNPEIGEARERVATSFNGESFTALFSARYLLDLLGVLSNEEVTFEFKDPTSPCLIREDSGHDASREAGKFLSIIMPLRD